MDENTTGVLTVFMFLANPVREPSRFERKTLIKLGGLTFAEASLAAERFAEENKDIRRNALHAHWQPHPIEIYL